MFEFLQNEKNNEKLFNKAEQIERQFEEYVNPFSSEVEGYLINDNHENQDDNRHIWRRITEIGFALNRRLLDDTTFSKNYINSVQNYYDDIITIISDEASIPNNSKNDIRSDSSQIRQLIQEWCKTYLTHEHLTPHRLFFIHNTVKGTKWLLELYQKKFSRPRATKTHLFEMGLKRLKLSDSQYVEMIFSRRLLLNRFINQSYERFLDEIKHFLHIHRDRYFRYYQSKRIKWIHNKTQEKAIREQLFEGVQYAELAYNHDSTLKSIIKHIFPIFFNPKSIKGGVKTTLYRYKINYAKYRAENINGTFHLQDNFNGFIGVRETQNNCKEIIVGFSGTNSFRHVLTDIFQFFGFLSTAYVESIGLIQSVWIGKCHKKGLENAPIKVYGHSLGGGLMQFAVANTSAKDIQGFGYNSAGLSHPYFYVLPHRYHFMFRNSNQQIYHLYKRHDIVFACKFTRQLGLAVNCPRETKNIYKAHILKSIRSDAGKYSNYYAELAP